MTLKLELGHQMFWKDDKTTKRVLSLVSRSKVKEERIIDRFLRENDNKMHFVKRQENEEAFISQKYKFKKTTAYVNKCPFERISSKISILDSKVKKEEEAISCQQHEMCEGACKYVSSYYKYEFDNYTCATTAKKDNEPERIIEICKFNPLEKRFECNVSECGIDFDGEVLIHLFDWTTGVVRPVRQGFRTTRELNDNVMGYARKTLEEGLQFMFVSCGFDETMSQLVMLDKEMVNVKGDHERRTVQKEKPKKINVNIVLFDSTARSHFFRSLKKTIHYLNEVNTNLNSKAEILDFELFQSTHGHTTENLHALFNGKIFAKTMTDKEKENGQTGFENFLRFAKKHGYETFYQEDMCWEGYYGLNSDLGMFTEWDRFYQEFKINASIDDTGEYFFSNLF